MAALSESDSCLPLQVMRKYGTRHNSRKLLMNGSVGQRPYSPALCPGDEYRCSPPVCRYRWHRTSRVKGGDWSPRRLNDNLASWSSTFFILSCLLLTHCRCPRYCSRTMSKPRSSRSEERRVGKEYRSRCSSSTVHNKL